MFGKSISVIRSNSNAKLCTKCPKCETTLSFQNISAEVDTIVKLPQCLFCETCRKYFNVQFVFMRYSDGLCDTGS